MSDASLSDLLSAVKNLAQGVNSLIQNYLNVQGQQNAAGLTTATVVKPSAGRLARVSVIVGGSAAGTIYDSTATGATTRPLYTIPTTAGIYEANLPANYGIVVSPGSGQTVTVSYS